MKLQGSLYNKSSNEMSTIYLSFIKQIAKPRHNKQNKV